MITLGKLLESLEYRINQYVVKTKNYTLENNYMELNQHSHSQEKLGGLVQGCGISIANALEIPQSCAMPSKYAGCRCFVTFTNVCL